jgi:tricarballylate dehydrogenase
MTPQELGKVDVLVIGAGNAACNAALSAHEAGATVALIETAPREARGGNSAFTGGAFRFTYGAVDDLLRLAPDIADLHLSSIDFGSYTDAQYFDDMGRLTEYRCDPDLTEVLIGNSFDAGLWLRKQGVRFQPALGRQAFKVDGRFKFWGGLACHILGGGQHLIGTLYQATESLTLAGFPNRQCCDPVWAEAIRTGSCRWASQLRSLAWSFPPASCASWQPVHAMARWCGAFWQLP